MKPDNPAEGVSDSAEDAPGNELAANAIEGADEGSRLRSQARALSKEFMHARRRFCLKWPKGKKIPENVKEEFSEATISRFRDPSKDNFRSSLQERLVRFMSPANGQLYFQLAEIIGQTEAEKDVILKEYVGRYRYFRYFEEGSGHKWKYTSGNVSIFNILGVPTFKHRSGDAPADRGFEHRGFVFLSGGVLFMLGYRKGVIRLASASPAHHQPAPHMWGVVNSVRMTLPYPFGSKFILVNENQKNLVKKLSGQGGEAEFRRMAEDQAFYLRGTGK